MNQVLERLEASVRQSLRNAIVAEELPVTDATAARASLIVHFIVGRWQRYAKTGFKRLPTEHLEAQLPLLLS